MKGVTWAGLSREFVAWDNKQWPVLSLSPFLSIYLTYARKVQAGKLQSTLVVPMTRLATGLCPGLTLRL